MSRRAIVPRILKSSGTWEAFKNALRPLDAKAKGDCFEALVEHYLKLSPIYTSILKHIWRGLDAAFFKQLHRNLAGATVRPR